MSFLLASGSHWLSLDDEGEENIDRQHEGEIYGQAPAAVEGDSKNGRRVPDS